MKADAAEQEIRTKNLVKILRDEFGIETMEELDAAISKMKHLDISVFCGKRGDIE